MNLEYFDTENSEIINSFEALKHKISESQEDLVGVFESYAKLLKISNQFCEHITAHDIKSCVFGIIMIVAADSCKAPMQERYQTLNSLPFFEFKSDVLSENTLDVIRIWNDFMFYFPKTLTAIESIYLGFEEFANLLKNLAAVEKSRTKHMKNFELVVKCIDTVKITLEKLKKIEENLREYSTLLKKPQYVEHLNKITAIVESCAGYGIENMMNLFSITPINKFPSN